MPQVKYSRLPTGDCSPASKDSVAFDFNSAFSYKSMYTYSKLVPPFIQQETEYKPPFVTRVCTHMVTFLAYLILLLTFPLSGWFAIKLVPQFERIVVFRLGRLQSPKGPGRILINPIIDKWKRVDMRTRAFNVPPQQVLTSDGAAISVGATVYHRITDVSLSIAGVQDMNHSIRTLAQTVLLNLLTSRELSNIGRDKVLLNAEIQEIMNGVTQNWGMEVSRAEISEITVLQEPTPPSLSFQKITNMFTHVAGQMTAGSGSTPQPPSGFSSLLSFSTGGQALPPSNASTSSQDQTQYQPPVNVPQQVPVTSTLVEVSSESALSPDELLNLVRPVMDEELVREIGAVYKFKVIGDSGGTYYLDLKTGKGRAAAGEPPSPADVTLTMGVEDMRAMFEGRLRPAMAYMSGRLQIEGDRNVALALEKVISRLQEAMC